MSGPRGQRHAWATLSLALLCWAIAGQRAEAEEAADYETLYRQVFGQAPSQEVHELSAQLRIDDRRIGTVEVQVPVHGVGVRVEAEPVLAALSEILLEDPLAQVESFADEDGWLSAEDLEEVGIESSFSERRLTLKLATPLEARRVTLLSIRDPGAGHGGRPSRHLTPARLSGYLNSSTRSDIRNTGSRWLQGFDGSLNYRGWVVQNAIRIDDGSNEVFRMDRLDLHRDDIGRSLRYTAGAFPTASLGPSTSDIMVGFSVASISTLSFYERPRPEIEEEFTLTSPATLQVAINQGVVGTYQLDPGRYQLRDFPVSSGINVVEVRAHRQGQDLFRVQRSLTWERDILTRGEHQYSLGAGIPTRGEDITRIPSPDTGQVSGLYRYGVNDVLTLGVSSTLDRRRREISTGALLGGSHGLWDVGAGLSHFDGTKLQGAGIVRFRSYSGPTSTPWLGNYGFITQVNTPTFGQSVPSTARSGQIATNSVYTELRFWQTSALGLRAFYNVSRGSRSDAYGANAALRVNTIRDLLFELTGDWRRDTQGRTRWFVSVRFTHSPRALGTRTRVGYQSADQSAEIDWTHQRTLFDEIGARLQYADTNNTNGRVQLTRGNWRGGANADVSLGRPAVASDLSYTGPRGRFAARYSFRDAQGLSEAEHRGELSATAALVYADGHFAMSRAVRDSFLILRPNPRFQSSRIRFSNNAIADGFGPAVVSNLRPLRGNVVNVLDADIPAGAWIPQRRHALVPMPDTGYLVTVGEGGGIVLEGVLLDTSGRAIGLRAGRFTPLSEPDAEAEPFFTAENGAFTLVDLQPGRYRLSVVGMTGQETVVDIPEDAPDVYDAGALLLGTPPAP